MTSQLVIFIAFLFIFFVPPTLDLIENSRKSTNKRNLALVLENYYVKSYRNAQIQVLFKALVILQYFTRQIYFSNTFQACANPALIH